MSSFLRKLRWLHCVCAVAAVLFRLYAAAQTSTYSTLAEIQVKSMRKPRAFTLGAAHCFSTFSYSPGYRGRVAVLLKPSAPARLTKVEIGMPAIFGADGVFRLLVLARRNGLPGEPILTDTVLIAAQKGRRFYSVPLDTFGLRADTSGIFVGLEWMTKYERREGGASQHLSLKMVRCADAAETFVSHLGRQAWERFAEMEARVPGGGTRFTSAAISGIFVPI